MRHETKRPALPHCGEIRAMLPDLLGSDTEPGLASDFRSGHASDRASSQIAAELPAIRAHLATCPDCRRELAEWKALRGALQEAWTEAQPPALDFAMASVPTENSGHRRTWIFRSLALLPGFPGWPDPASSGRGAWIAMQPRFATVLTVVGFGLTAVLLGALLSASRGSLRQAWFATNTESQEPGEDGASTGDPAPISQDGGPAQATRVVRSAPVAALGMASLGTSGALRSTTAPDGKLPVGIRPPFIDPTQVPLLQNPTPQNPSGSQGSPSLPQQPDETREPDHSSDPDHPSEPTNPHPTTSVPEPTPAAATTTDAPGHATPQPTAVARVAGRVEDAAGLGLAWALVYLRPWPEGEGRFLLTDTADDGSFFLDLPAGSYRLWVEAEGYEPGWYGGEVADVIDLPPAAERRDLKVRLDPAERPPLILPAPSPTAQTLPLPIPAPDR